MEYRTEDNVAMSTEGPQQAEPAPSATKENFSRIDKRIRKGKLIMGFWDALGKIAQSGINKLNETNMEVQAKAEQFESKSDEELKSILRSGWSSYADKVAASKVLKQRGY